MMTDTRLRAVASGVAAAAVLIACSSEAGIEGNWVEPVPGMENMTQGFSLKADGKASSINMTTLQYDAWKQEGGRLILSGKSIGNGITIPVSDTFVVEKLTPDSLILKKQLLTLKYSRAETAGETVPMAKLVPAKKLSFVTEGTLVFAHETRSFTPSGSPVSYWVVDKTGKLSEDYDRLTGGVKNGTPVYAELEVVDMGKSDEGFAKSYESVYQVVKINGLSLSKGDEAVVSEDRVWSKLLNDSVSLSGAVRTDAVDGRGSSIHVIFSPDSLKAELFISGQKESAVLDRRTLFSGAHVWNVEDDDTWNLRRTDGLWTVSKRGKVLFSQHQDRP